MFYYVENINIADRNISLVEKKMARNQCVFTGTDYKL